MFTLPWGWGLLLHSLPCLESDPHTVTSQSAQTVLIKRSVQDRLSSSDAWSQNTGT